MSVFEDLPPAAVLLSGPNKWRAQYGPLSGEQTASWLVPFEDVRAFVDVAFFTPETLTVPGGKMTVVVPLRCRWDDRLYATDVQLESFSASTEDPADPDAQDWEQVVATVRFGVLPYSFDGDRPAVEIQIEGGVEQFTLPNYPYSFLGTMPLEKIAQDIGIPVGSVRIGVTWHEIVDLPAALAVVAPLAGKVNTSAMTIRGLHCEPHTLHFQTFSSTETITVGGSYKARLSMTLAWRPSPHWNQAMKANGSYGLVDPQPLPDTDLGPLLLGLVVA